MTRNDAFKGLRRELDTEFRSKRWCCILTLLRSIRYGTRSPCTYLNLCASGGLQSDLMRPAVRTDEMASSGSRDTLMEDETASDLEVERTLVEDENSDRMVLVEQPTTHAR